MRGPTIIAPVVSAVHVPMALARATPEKWALMSASELGTRKAPAAPWSMRAMTRVSGSGATVMITEAMPNPMRPMRMTRSRP